MTQVRTIKIAIADNYPLMRQGIKEIIGSFDGFEVVAEGADGDELISTIINKRRFPDICILNTNIHYIYTLQELKKTLPAIKVLIFSLFHSEFIIHEMVRNGVNGYIENTCDSRTLLQALSSIYHNDYYFSGAVAKKIFDTHKRKLMPRVTEREIEFLSYCCSELSYKDISDRMEVSVRTVESYRDTLFAKFNIKSRIGLVMFALQNDIVPLNNPVSAELLKTQPLPVSNI